MITVNKTEMKDLRKLRTFLKAHKLEETLFIDRLDQTVVILDGQNILGFGAFIIKEETGLIDVAIVEEEILWPSMGDGLIKTMLNTLDLRGIKKAFLLTDEAHGKIIKKIGLTESEQTPENVLAYIGAPWIMKSLNKVYETTLPDFFDHACHSAK